MNRLVVATIAFLCLIPLASAEMPKGQRMMHDQVVLNLTTEGWVQTDTAKVSVFVDLVQQQETPEELKKRIDDSLVSLAKDAEWRVTSSNQRLDQTGLNRWYVTAEARVHESLLPGLQDRAKSASSPGYKVGISFVDFTPSLAEFEKLRADLRSDIYKQAVAEVERLNAVLPGSDYHVQKVDFVQQYAAPRMENMRAQTMMVKSQADEAGSGGGAQLVVSVNQSLSAQVVLGRAVPLPAQ
ncbi:MAG: hypothetical protein NXI13_10575 [Proteobacteria bacterium]|nr:hypothetical protein [Pseudomonadota bacterium]